MENVDTFNISGVDGGKEGERGKLGVYVTVIMTYKNNFVVNSQTVAVSLALG